MKFFSRDGGAIYWNLMGHAKGGTHYGFHVKTNYTLFYFEHKKIGQVMVNLSNGHGGIEGEACFRICAPILQVKFMAMLQCLLIVTTMSLFVL